MKHDQVKKVKINVPVDQVTKMVLLKDQIAIVIGQQINMYDLEGNIKSSTDVGG